MQNFVEQIYRKRNDYKGIIFLDRDGTINKYLDYLKDVNRIEILPKVIDAIKHLNKYNIAILVITNQPLVARGLASIKDVKKINDELVGILNNNEAYIDAIYSCPHHPEKNHSDIPAYAMKYRIDCDCRKPQTAMFKKAVENYGDKKLFGMIGDHGRDILAGKNFGIKTVLLKNDQTEDNELQNTSPDFICDNLLDAVRILL
jgi:D-glycero-D-manno-heptose 1,7-bisphosphate phosphatase